MVDLYFPAIPPALTPDAVFESSQPDILDRSILMDFLVCRIYGSLIALMSLVRPIEGIHCLDILVLPFLSTVVLEIPWLDLQSF